MKRVHTRFAGPVLVLAGAAASWGQGISISGCGGDYSIGPITDPITVTGGTKPYLFAITAGSLPNGLHVRTDNPSPLPPWWPANAPVAIVGVATAPDVNPPAFTLTVTDVNHNSQSVACVISVSPQIITDNYQLPDGFLNVGYSFTASSSGAVGAVTWSLAQGNSLPGGLSLAPATGLISGTPNAPGFYNFTLIATDANGPIFRGYNLNVYGAGIGNSPFLGTTNPGDNVSILISGQGGTGPYTFTGSGFPPGVSINAAGLISGTVGGNTNMYQPSITVTDSANHSYTRQFALEVLGGYFPPSMGYPNPAEDATIGEARSYWFNAWGGVGPYHWSTSGGSLPSGMALETNLNNVGPLSVLIAGAPTQLGTYPFTVNMTDSSNPPITVAQPFTIQVKDIANDYPQSPCPFCSPLTFGQAFSFYLRPIGGVPPFQWSIVTGSLPAGVSFDSKTGMVSGTPTENGNFSIFVNIGATGVGDTVNRWIGFNVATTTNPQIIIYNAPPDASSNQNYDFFFNVCCTNGTPEFTVASGTVPPGLTLTSAGELHGVPTDTVQKTYTFTVQVSDSANPANIGLHVVTMNVSPLSPIINTPSGLLGQGYGGSLTATGGTGTLTWTLDPGSALPPGLTLNSNGTFSGTALSPGIFNFTFTVTDSAGNTFRGYANIDIGPATPFSQIPFNLGTFPIGEIDYALTEVGGNGTETWNLAAGSKPLPPGMAVRPDVPPWFPPNAAAGIIGVATTAGTYPFTLQVTSGGNSSTENVTMKISNLTLKDGYRIPDGFVSTQYNYTLTALNNAGPVTWSSNYGMPPGLTLSANGVLSGTPTQPGFYNIGLQINDGTDTVGWQTGLNISTIQITTTSACAPGTPDCLPSVPQYSVYNYPVHASGGTPPYQYTTNSLPNGLAIDQNTGVISGNDNAGPGTWYFNLTVTDANQVSYAKPMSITTIGVPLALPNLNGLGTTDCSFGLPCDRVITVGSGGTPPFTWSISGLPQGMGFRFGTGKTDSYLSPPAVEIWGIPTQLGPFTVKVVVTDANLVSATQTYPLNVSALEVNGNDFLPNGTIGVAYSKTLRVLGGSPPYTVKMVGGSLPAGLSLNGFTVSGTPIENGSFGVTLVFSDSASNTIEVGMGVFIGGGSSTITVNNTNIGTFTVNSPVNYQLSACCAPSFTWQQVGGTLPPGLTLSAGGLLSGTPTTANTYTFLVQAADQTNPANVGIRQITMVITPLVITTNGPLPYGNVNTQYGPSGQGVTLTATGGAGTLHWTLANGSLLPPGLTLSDSGVIGGAPTATGQYFFQVQVTDSAGNFAVKGFGGIAVYATGATPPLNLPVGPNLGTFGPGPFYVALTATGGVPPYHYSLTPGANVVTGLNVQDGPLQPTFFSAGTTGGYLGVTTAPGTFSTSLRVTDSANNTFDRAVNFTVLFLETLSANPLPKATVLVPYSFTFTGFGGSGVYSWSASGLPPGLSMNSSGQITGTPGASGTFNFSVSIVDQVNTVQRSVGYTLQVNPFAISNTPVLPQGTAGTAYSQKLVAPGCGSGCTWTALNGLPGGLSLDSSTGLLSGTPGTFNGSINIQVQGSNGTVQQLFGLTIVSNTPQPLFINIPASLTAFNGQTFIVDNFPTIQLFAQGGTPPYTWAVVDPADLPPGLSLQTPGETLGANYVPGFSYLWGRTMQAGTYNFSLKVTDSASTSITQAFTLTVGVIQLSCCFYTNLPVPGTPLLYNSPYSQALLPIGGSGNYTGWTALTPLPPGLSLSGNGVISGMPGNTGFFSTAIQITDSNGTTSVQNVNFNIASPTGVFLSLNGPFLGTRSGDTLQIFNLNPSGGTPPYTITAVNPLPAGFSLQTGDQLLSNGQGSYDLVVQPFATPGNYTVRLQLTDSVGNIAVRDESLTIAPFDLFTLSNLADGSVNTPYSQEILIWDNPNPGTLTWSIAAGSALPPGLNIVGTTISGVPTTAGTYSFRLNATDSSGIVIAYTFNLHISTISITNPNSQVISQAAVVGVPFTLGFTASGGGANKGWSATGLPAGLNMSATGTLSGTTFSSGAYQLTVTVSDGSSTLTESFTLFVNFPDPTLLTVQGSTALPDIVMGQSFAYGLSVDGGVPPYTWQLAPSSKLPSGVNLYSGAALSPNQTPGSTLLEGAPTQVGSYSFDLIVTDSAVPTPSKTLQTFTLNVSQIGISAGNLRNATTGVAYSEQLTPVGGSATDTYTFTYGQRFLGQDQLPPGITASPSGLISGTTNSTGNYNFLATAKDQNTGAIYTTGYTLSVVNANGLQVFRPGPFNLIVGIGINRSLTTNQNSTYAWTVTGGSLPAGLSLLNQGGFWSLTGVPTAPGPFSYTLRATDNANNANFAERVFSGTVSPMQQISHPVPPAQQGTAYTPYNFQMAGGQPPYTFTALPVLSPLPPGMSLSAGGTLSGTPLFTGSYFFFFEVTDANQATVYGAATLDVLAPGATDPVQGLSNMANAQGAVGEPAGIYALDLTLTGGVAPFTWSITSGSLPPGVNLVLGAAGISTLVAGIPTTAGAYPFTLQATDAAGQIALLTGTFTIAPPGPGLTPLSLPNGAVNSAYAGMQLPVTGGTPPYTFQLNPGSSMPVGLTLNAANGNITGTPLFPGVYSLSVGVTDSANNSANQSYTLVIDNAAGQAPGIRASGPAGEGALQLAYIIGSAAPASISIPVSSTSGNLAFAAMVAGVPGASLSAAGGTTPATLTMSFDTTQLTAPGQFLGAVAVKSAPSANGISILPILLTVTSAPPCTYSLPVGAGDVPSAAGGASFAINAGPNCQWTATSNAAWLTTSSTGFGNGIVSFKYTLNSTGAARSGTITVGGQTYTVTQFAASAPGTCTYTVTPLTVNASAAGGSATITVKTTSNCAWSVTNPTNGLTVVPPGGSSGTGTAVVNIPANNSTSTIVMNAGVGGQTFTVNQTGVNCAVTLGASSLNAVAGGQGGSVVVNAPGGCPYATNNIPTWVTPVAGAAGNGPGTFSFTVAANSTTVQRSATLSVGGQPFTIIEDATACSVTLDTSAVPATFAAGGGLALMGITANGQNCSWNASSNNAFASVAPGSGTGNGSVSVTVSSNGAAANSRSTSIVIAGTTVPILQSGTACTYTLTSSTASTPYTGGGGSVSVIAPAACAWISQLDPNAAWLSISSSGSGGSSSVSFVAAPNPTSSARSGTLTIANQSFTVTEAAAPCNYLLNATSTTVASSGSASPLSFTFSTGASGCSVTAVSYANWISGVNTASSPDGTSGTVTYSVAPNPNGTTRTGTIQVGAQTYTVSQTGAACAFSLNQYGYLFNSSGGAGTVASSPSAQGCVPTVGTTQPSVVTLGNLTGPNLNIFDLPFTVSNFSSLVTAVRFAQITDGGQIVIVKQTSW